MKPAEPIDDETFEEAMFRLSIDLYDILESLYSLAREASTGRSWRAFKMRWILRWMRVRHGARVPEKTFWNRP